MDFLSLILLSFGLSLDDFALAFALCLALSSQNNKDRIIHTSKMALAFSVSTAGLPLLGWIIGKIIFNWLAAFGAWVVLIVFCGVGGWIIKEAFENESSKWKDKNLSSFWVLLVMGILGSIDEGAVGIGFPFLNLSLAWIIISVIIINTIFIYLAMYVSTLTSKINQKIPPILSGLILICLGILNWIGLLF